MSRLSKILPIIAASVLFLEASSFTPQEKLLKTEEYLCKSFSQNLCGINKSYFEFEDIDKKYLHQINNGTFETADDTIPEDIKTAIEDIKDITSLYEIDKILISEIKFSNYYEKSVAFIDMTLDPLQNKADNYKDLWNEILNEYEKKVTADENTYTDPYKDAVFSWDEFGNNFIDSAKLLKKSGVAAWSISKATFLKPYVDAAKAFGNVRKVKDAVQTTDVLINATTDLIPELFNFITKIYDEALTTDDIESMINAIDSFAAISDQYKESSTNNIIFIVNGLKDTINIIKQKRALDKLKDKYADNMFIQHTLGKISTLYYSNLIKSVSSAIVKLNDLLPENTVSDMVGVANDLQNVVNNQDVNVRKSLLKDSLSTEYFKVYQRRMSFNRSLYTSFMYNFFALNTDKIIIPKEYGLSPLPEPQEPAKNEIYLAAPYSSTITHSNIKTKAGDKIELIFTEVKSGEVMSQWLQKAMNNNLAVTLWYDNHTTNQRASIPLKVDSLGWMEGFYPFYFEAPSDNFTLIKLSYNDPDRGGMVAFDIYDFGYEVSYKIASDSPNNANQDESYEQCIANGGTEIGCRIGIHLVSSLGMYCIERDNGLFVQGDYAYVSSCDGYTGDKLIVLDIGDKTNIKNISQVKLSNTNAYKTIAINNKVYVFGSNYIEIIDISNPYNPIYDKKVSVDKKYDNIYIENDKPYSIDITHEYNQEIQKIYINDISELNNSKIVRTLDFNTTRYGELSTSLYLDRNTLYIKTFEPILENGNVVDSNYYLSIFDLSTNNLNLKNKIPLKNNRKYYTDIFVENNVLYIGDHIDGYVEKFDLNKMEFTNNKPTYIYNGNYIIKHNYIYNIEHSKSFNIIDLGNGLYTPLIGMELIDGNAYDVTISDNFAYVAKVDNSATGLTIIDINDPTKPKAIGKLDTDGYSYGIAKSGNKTYVSDNNKLKILDVSDPTTPLPLGTFDIGSSIYSIEVQDNFAYVASSSGLKIVDVRNPGNPFLKGSTGSFVAKDVEVRGHFAYVADSDGKLLILDVVDPTNPKQVGTYRISDHAARVEIKDNFAYVVTGNDSSALFVLDISDPAYPRFKGSVGTPGYALSVAVKGDYAYVADGPDGIMVVDISNRAKPVVIESINTQFAQNVTIDGKYLYVADREHGLKIYDTEEIIKRHQILQEHYHPGTEIALVNETHSDYSIQTKNFKKSWTFSENIGYYDIEVISSSYANKPTPSDFTKNGNELSVSLSPNLNKVVNKLELKFIKNGNPVKVDGSDTFWSITKTNHAPRFSDGQITQLVSTTDEPAYLVIDTYDSDGDSVILSIEDDAGGYVGFLKENPHKLFASFNDGKTMHTIKVGLNDGKEKVIKELHVLQFNQSSIEDFYSDVKKSAPDYPFDGIAFGTLKGVVWGQPDPNDSTKRIFRPKDDTSMAEALAMIINAEKKTGLINLESSKYYLNVYPSWATAYYTFAKEAGAIDEISDLSSYYPTREEIANIIVRTLGLDKKTEGIKLDDISFDDEGDFSDASMLNRAKIVKSFGLFLNQNIAKPKEKISRAELALVIQKIFMLPQGKLLLKPTYGKIGENFSYELNITKAETIDTNYKPVDNKSNLKIVLKSKEKSIETAPIENRDLDFGPNTIYAIVENDGVKNIFQATYTLRFNDKDGDLVEDSFDKWGDDPRYAYDENNNSIPDVLDKIYRLDNYDAESIVTINGQQVAVIDIIKKGVVVPDLDGDGISDYEDNDIDGDGVANELDAFPKDPNESIDTDGDGIGNNADTDDDNDGISDADEIKYGLDPLNGLDAALDSDGDGVSNIDEIKAGTDPKVNNQKNSSDNNTTDAETQIALPIIDDIYLHINSEPKIIDLQTAANKPSNIDYEVVSSNEAAVMATIDGSKLKIEPVTDAKGVATITLTAQSDVIIKTISFNVVVEESHIAIKTDNDKFEPIQDKKYELSLGDIYIEATVDENESLEYDVTKDEIGTSIIADIPGTRVEIAEDGNATLIIPAFQLIKIEVTRDGTTQSNVKGAALPVEPLPMGTKIDVNQTHLIFTVPLPERLIF